MVQFGVLRIRIVTVCIFLFFIACGESAKDTKKTPAIKKIPKPKIERPNFSEDSAYIFIQQQVNFGPRVPNTEAHKKAGNYLAAKLRSFSFEVTEQEGVVTAFNEDKLSIKNIIGSYKTNLNNRIMLFAHWDSRPFADNDSKDIDQPIDGANDGASGVGILLEIARQIQLTQPEIGVDIFFFDAEDYGQPSNSSIPYKSKTWCLGSQFWTANPHKAAYRANFGILLDMVGAKNAIFTKEAISRYYASSVLNKVWNIAFMLGHDNHFVPKETNHVGEDDHLYINKLTGIPCIDIIQYDPSTRAFAPHWHTHDDNMDIIDKNTLEAVGETVLATVISEGKVTQ